jgi:hypothetical protein
MEMAHSIESVDGLLEAHEEHRKYLEALEKATTFNECPEVDNNIFACLLSDRVVQKDIRKGYTSGKSRTISDGETGEVIKVRDNTVFFSKQYVDNDKYIKLYMDGFRRFFDLSHPAYKVFGYFISELQKNKDTDIVHFSMQECMDYCEYKTHPMVYRALTELILKEFICKSSKYKFAFYVNPLNVCNGKRSRFIVDIINKDKVDELSEDKKRELENW